MAVLSRGYSIITLTADGKVVARKSRVKDGDDLRVRVQDGEFDARVTGNPQVTYGKKRT
jgi:exonuclease VII large subunit